MAKKTIYTKITPLPRNVPRQLAIEMLHSHKEVIELNPLVTGVKQIDAPRDAPNDEYFSQWYEISEIITWGFGLRKKIAFKGVFHDQPYGLQSHVYAPMGVDLRNKYRIGGNQPGEPRETRELGVDTPLDGLYLREDVEIVCNIALASFVKKETKEATGKMIERLARKAELLDEGKLHAMFEDGMLKTAKPSAFSDDGSQPSGSMAGTPPGSPSPSMAGFGSPRLDKKGYGNYHDISRTSSQHRTSQYLPAYQQQGYNGPDHARLGAQQTMPMINELPGSYEQPPQNLFPDPLKPHGAVFRSELPGDSSFNSTTAPSQSFGSTATPSPQPSPRAPSQSSLDLKPPVQYQAYAPPSQQHPTDRNTTLTPSHNSYNEHQQQQPQPQSPNYSRPNVAQWQQSVSNTSQHSISRNSSTGDGTSYQQHQQQSRPSSSIVPDHQRFSNLSVQDRPPQQAPRPVSNSGYQHATHAKCPVCGLFEGDEAAVSHHVSKAHFS
ncbi:hypothetical protein CLAFUW4_12431 [Fulvia fulva]|uniref:DUF7053 domain-containing protein n=1 Tax=Passalora fulva TaxID=5499 RepID=A0A9Q8PDQ6_PASFU|nr:uncharacterized protein CLAFUR5_11459 [Fulvia fulva]KAK4619038.1 hypothetical protein CLAFUR0_12447 [Fulvia fulva]UJO20527.1 hypothetical protein CLAFUR5_11459 [Fulvia fulva]WPV18040.1 hypothetical protein CLAFUW4_12431 [Fulvia fulva]WPV33342.1 hypothetical protein CLAFUW7_12438 [Fulvia fulva]